MMIKIVSVNCYAVVVYLGKPHANVAIVVCPVILLLLWLTSELLI